MTEQPAQETAHRLIVRDEAIRGASKAPPWNSVRKIIDYVVEEKLLSDPIVSRWLRTLASGADMWITERLLQIVRALLDAGTLDEAHMLYRCVLGLDERARWSALAPALARASMLVEAGFEPVLGRPGLLVNCPSTWGQTACELLGRVVVEHQRREWPFHFRLQAALAKDFGQSFDAEQPFEPAYDDSPSLWYFGRHDSHASRSILAVAVERGLREAATLPDAGTFRLLAGQLVGERFAIGIGLVLTTLLDCLQGTIPRSDWHADEAVRLLSLDAVQQHVSLGSLRRLLRRELPRPGDALTAATLIDVIRRSSTPESSRLCELSDLAEWGLLQAEEVAAVSAAAKKDELPAPIDPRKRPAIGQSGWLPSSSSAAGLGWPHPEDANAIELLSRAHQEPSRDAPLEGLQQNLERRLDALRSILAREECDSEGWVGEILGWCHRAVTDVRTCELRRLGRDPEDEELVAEEWEEVLNARAPWWRERAEVALRCLGGAVPAYHAERRPGGLHWPMSDCLLQSLAYLDELLAIGGEGSFALLRERLETAVDAAWRSWPAFTRATALSVLRPWYWRNLERLRFQLSRLAEGETDPLVAQYAVERLLNIGGPDLAANLERFLQRAAALEDFGRTINRMGRTLGYTLLRHAHSGEGGQVVEELVGLYGRLQNSPPTDLGTRGELIDGLLWGAGDCLKEMSSRTEAQAAVWGSLVRWAASQWPYFTESSSEADRFPILAVARGLEQQWPPGARHRLFDDLAEPLLRILREGTLGDYCWFHYEMRNLLSGKSGRSGDGAPTPMTTGEVSDDLLLSFCRASADRVLSWSTAKKTTSDLGWVSALSGQETADLIRAVVDAGSDRDYLRRELPQIIDHLAEAGCTGTATALRLYLRRN